ncbi:MAG: long-chain fatty acid--CoA ligase [Gammaproteobacteria bacterium]|nr:long-chain fatty acid--CoA ligase [Gammaproteobacteria bacterium]
MTEWNEDIISPESVATIDSMFIERVRRSGDRPAYKSYEREQNGWIEYSWQQMAVQVARWQSALAHESLHPGDRVALLLRNCPQWVMFDQASLGLGLVVVPLYTDDRAENIAYILNDAAVKLLLVQDAGRWKRLAPILGESSFLRRVLLLDAAPDAQQLADSDERIRLVSNWLPEREGDLRRRKGGNPHELASIVYTSGTTGRPKGVMLSHHNMLSVAHGGVAVVDCYREDVFLSFLPLSHTLERTAGYYLPVMTGSMVAYSRSVGQLAQDLQIIRPTVMIAVPRIFERVYGRLKEQLSSQSVVARWLFTLAISVGWRRFLVQQRRAGWSPQLLLWPLLQRLVASKVLEKLGGRLRVAVSGGAPLSPEIARVFIGLGLPLLQGYGLTETSPVISINPLENNEPASVGIPLRKIKVKIGEDNELLVRSPGVMLGYWNNHAATRAMIDAEGWLHTGDQARIEDEHLYITGRIKDILVLSNGEKVPPGDMELAIALDPLVSQVLVVGEGRPYLTALLVLDAEFWPGLAQECGLNPMDPAGLNNPRLVAVVLKHIKNSLSGFPGFAKIRRITLLLEPWTIDNDLLTPTLKVKRAKVLQRYAAEVDRMYEDGLTA